MSIFSNIGQNTETKVYSFVGPSGTGKSYRAQMVASENDIHYIIDDGLLVNDNAVVAGTSAKKAPTKIETVKRAIFLNEQDKNEMKKALKKYKPESILILGTSDGMIDKITKNLGLPEVSKRIYIQDVATETEMETAKRIRTTQGKHVIPVPTFEIKKDFSGYILDPLQIFKFKGKGQEPYMSEKSIIRPTFSYLGNFTISDTVFRQIADYLATKDEAIYKVIRNRVESTEEGPNIYMELSINYGYNIISALRNFKIKIKKEIEKLTTMNIQQITIIAKGIHMPENRNINEKGDNKEKMKLNSNIVIAIDGPAGSGKGTIAKEISKEFEIVNIDTGAMYRCLTLECIKNGIKTLEDLEYKEKIINIAQNIDIKMKNDNGKVIVFLNGEDVSDKIRSNEVTKIVSPISSIIEVRKIMVEIQRKMAKSNSVIMEGRDITTVVFPNADVKIYLDAKVEERARRRFKENQEKGILGTYEQVLEDIKKRDYNDMHKEVGSLMIAKDAIVVDSTELSIEEVKNKIKDIILNKINIENKK